MSVEQRTLAMAAGFEKHRKRTRRAEFLAQMEVVVPWRELVAEIEPFYPKAGGGRPPVGLERMLRMYFLQQWFNMCGSRVTNTEISAWMDSHTAGVYVADATDKFGDMGTVAIFIVLEEENALRIPVFVLSCRVFGYGIETAILNFVKRMAAPRHIIGNFKETASNGQETYPQHGFQWDETIWRYTSKEEPTDPEWLKIQTPLSNTIVK